MALFFDFYFEFSFRHFGVIAAMLGCDGKMLIFLFLQFNPLTLCDVTFIVNRLIVCVVLDSPAYDIASDDSE